jgi:hypothetical protein
LAGSVKKANTFSMGAAMVTVRDACGMAASSQTETD